MRLDQAVALRVGATDAVRAILNGEVVWESVVPIVATGGSVFDINGYRVHAFYASGTFEVTSIPEGASDQVEYLIVGGGGSGGQGGGGAGGGGGGGGVRTGTVALTVGSYSIVVGAGGAAHSTTTTRGNAGGSSSFAGVTAAGGGAGARTTSGGAGSSGGGGGPGQAGGAGTVGQGYDGTAGVLTGSSPNRTFTGGGGGGASSAAGTANVAVSGGDGGAEVISTITGRAIGYGGGGGGASGRDASGVEVNGGAGSTSGGNGGRSRTGLTGSPYRGGGGGGGGFNAGTAAAGQAGGSGVVIVRYPHPDPLGAYVEPTQPAGWESASADLRVSNQTVIAEYGDPNQDYVIGPYGCVADDGSLLLGYRTGVAHNFGPGRVAIIRGYHRPYAWETPHWSPQPHALIEPPAGYDDAGDPKLCTLPNGNVLIAYHIQISATLETHARVRISTDNGATFGAAINPNDGVPTWTGKLVPGGPEVRDDGSIIMPVWGRTEPGASVDTMALWRSTDGGETWSQLAALGAGQEPELVRGDSASEWLVFFRGGAKRSTDDGATWATLTTTLTVNNWVKPVRSPLTGNLLACIRNGVGGPPAVVMSTDDGATWSPPLASESGSGVQLGAYIFTDSSGSHTLIHAVEPSVTAVKCSLLQELTP